MKRALLFLAAMLVLGGIAHAANITGPMGCDGWGLAGLTGKILCSAAPPPSGNALLLEDASSVLLLEDGSSFLCLEGGC